MQVLIDFAERNYDFFAVLSRATKYPVVQGVVLDVDRYFLWAWHMQQRLGPGFVERAVDHFGESLLFAPWIGRGLALPPGPPGPPVRPITRDVLDNWRPPGWYRRQDYLGLAKTGWPLVAKVCLRPPGRDDTDIPSVEVLQPAAPMLLVEIETRPQARLAANPRRVRRPLAGGVSIGVGARDYGTLGVVLTDSAGKHYGLTCAHVAAQHDAVVQPSRRDSGKASQIGTSVKSTTLTACAGSTPCSPWGSAAAHDIDVSLIDIDAAAVASVLEVLDIGVLNGVVPRASLGNAQDVEVMGRSSKYSRLRTGGLAAWYRFTFGGSYYCFHNLFEVQSPYGGGSVIRDGDSGAPVCTAHGSGTGWCGLVVGCDGANGFAMYAETVEAWWRSEGYSLQVL